MSKVMSMRRETDQEEELRKWFQNQELESPKNIEEAARLIIGLVTGLLGILFAVLTVSAENLPIYLSIKLVKVSGITAIIFWLLSLLSSLFVVIPREMQFIENKPVSQVETFSSLRRYKSIWLMVSTITFGLGIIALGIVLVSALLLI